MKFDDEEGEWEAADWRADLLGCGYVCAAIAFWTVVVLWGLSVAFRW